MALVSGRLENRDLGSAVAEIRSRLAELRLPVGYTSKSADSTSPSARRSASCSGSSGSRSVLVFTILVLQFRRSLRRC